MPNTICEELSFTNLNELPQPVNIYTPEEAYEASLNYFNGDELAASAFVSKYALKRKEGDSWIYYELTPDDMHKRIARELARIEENYPNPLSYEEIYNTIKDFKYIVPQGSPMAGIGNPFQLVSLSNCVVIEGPQDSISKIMDTAKDLANLSKRRAGVGTPMDALRPDGTKVNNSAGTSTGAWSFCNHFSNIAGVIGQGGRRAALMLSMLCNHPDIMKFVVMKHDRKNTTNANVSVMITDEFMQAVINDSEWDLVWPVDSTPETAKVHEVIKARDLWRLINESATHHAEPGLLFWDNYLKNLPAECYAEDGFKTICVNPCCFSEDSEVWVPTRAGLKEIKTITPEDEVWVDSEQKYAKTSGYFHAGEAEVFSVKFSNGETLEITANHKLEKVNYKRRGTKCRATEKELVKLEDLKIGDLISISSSSLENGGFGTDGTLQEGYILGWLTGDGCLSYKNDFAVFPTMYLSFWQSEYDVAYKVLDIVNKEFNLCLKLQEFKDSNHNIVKRIASSKLTELLTEKYETNLWKFKSKFNPFLFKASKEFLQGYLSSYFSADGTVTCNLESSNFNIQLASIDKERLWQIKHILSLFGIRASFGIGKAAGTSTIRGVEYNTKTIYRINITGNENLKLFNNHIGFICGKKQQTLEKALSHLNMGKLPKHSNYTKIVSIELVGIKPVGCIEVPEYHQFVANGICSGNSEIGLSAYDSCRLMSINLKNFVINPFEKNAHFDFKTFARIVSIGQRLMDDIVDLEIEALDNIINNVDDYDEKILWGKLKQAAIDGRRTGLGTHALADCLACLGIKYDTPEALDIVNKIYQMFRDVSYLQGTQLAAERGPFSCFSWEKEKDNAFIQRLPEYVKNSIKEHGRRNISQLTMAPTGTVSIECQTSSGIEPVFRIYYSRKKKINPSDTNMRVDFEDVVGNKWQIFDVFHHNVLDYFKKHPEALEQWEEIKAKYPPEKREEKLREILPDYFISSDQINWESRVDLQGIIQSYICHGISSTINLPRNTPVEEVEKIYMRAWERGLKGVTVYVEGSREDVLSSNVAASDRPSDVSETHAPKRPDILPCDIHYSSIDNLQWIIFVSKFNNKPYEIFAGLAENVDIPKKYSEGFIKKRNGEKANAKGRTARYDLIVGDTSENKKIIEDIVVTFDNPGYATQTRLISCLLRHGVSVSTIAEQLSRDLNENLFSFNKVIARVLKKYIKDGTGSGENCSNCGAKLRFEGGCYICPSCAESKCG